MRLPPWRDIEEVAIPEISGTTIGTVGAGSVGHITSLLLGHVVEAVAVDAGRTLGDLAGRNRILDLVEHVGGDQPLSAASPVARDGACASLDLGREGLDQVGRTCDRSQGLALDEGVLAGCLGQSGSAQGSRLTDRQSGVDLRARLLKRFALSLHASRVSETCHSASSCAHRLRLLGGEIESNFFLGASETLRAELDCFRSRHCCFCEQPGLRLLQPCVHIYDPSRDR